MVLVNMDNNLYKELKKFVDKNNIDYNSIKQFVDKACSEKLKLEYNKKEVRE